MAKRKFRRPIYLQVDALMITLTRRILVYEGVLARYQREFFLMTGNIFEMY